MTASVDELIDAQIEPLRHDAEFAISHVVRPNGSPCFLVSPLLEQPASSTLLKLENTFALRDELDAAWAARPLGLVRFRNRLALLIEQRGDFLDKRVHELLAPSDFLRLAIAIASSLAGLHRRGLVHKDVRPANLLGNARTGEVWLTGFSLTTRLPRHRQPAGAPENIAGTLAYMAPEQTGRMNRSIDTRSDLYSLGVTLYELCAGGLPFTASDPIEWVHCHMARVPVSPSLRRSEIPEAVSAIILKLLAKAPEERYQTALGVEADLRRCLSEWVAHGRIDTFSTGARDVPDHLVIPEKLYGREKEIALLLAAFERVGSEGTTELVLVSGFSGVGKSSVVQELHKALVPRRGLFASGKFDQYKREVPYATIAQALGTLVRQLLTKADDEMARWRALLADALGPNGRLIVDLVPELELIIGEAAPVAPLPPQDARHRFQKVLRAFVGVFARAEHPLALFLDDLQWLDTATLELMEQMIADRELRHLLLVGAYRDNEVDPEHSLRRTLLQIRAAGTKVQDIVLSPLELDDVTALAADALHCSAEKARPLSQLIHEKTTGNPFFATQFITTLTEENLVCFDSATASWKWDLPRIVLKGYTDNVVELMVAKLHRQPEATQNSLKQLACVGHSAGTATLKLIYGQNEPVLHSTLWQAVHLGLVNRSDDTYSFAHDRIQQAAYSLIPEPQRSDIHLHIGRVLLTSMAPDQLTDHLFDVANQLNRGAATLSDRDETLQVAAINLRAGRKAKESAAYASALTYFAAGIALSTKSDWAGEYQLMFGLRLECAECEFLTGHLDRAEQLLAELLPRAASRVDEAGVYNLKIQLHLMKGELHASVDSAVTCLRRFGIDVPAHPTEQQVQSERSTLSQTLGARPIEGLLDLPAMTDPELQAAMKVLAAVLAPAHFTDLRLCCWLACRMVTLSVQYGTSVGSASAYSYWGSLLESIFHSYREGYRFSKLACDVVEKHDLLADRALVLLSFANCAPWTQPLDTAIAFSRTGIRCAIDTGRPFFACVGMVSLISNLLLRSDPLDAVWHESEEALNFARTIKHRDYTDMIVGQQRFIATMQGRSATFSTFSDTRFDEASFEAGLTADRLPRMICKYWIIKMKARFISRDYAEALAAAKRAKQLLEASVGHLSLFDFTFYAALTLAALYDAASTEEQAAFRRLLLEHQEKLQAWAENYSPTFGATYALVSAEIARLEKRDADAMRLYEQATGGARDHGFVQHEALANEVAARFYEMRGVAPVAELYLRNARYCYSRWGAHGKVKQLERLYPSLAAPDERGATALNASIGTPFGQLEAETVARASQALSSEIVLPTLVERLMRIALEHVGAERGLLILLQGSQPLIEAEAVTGHGRVDVQVRQAEIGAIDLPQSALHYVIRTQECVLVHDASVRHLYSEDPYFAHKECKSILCLPIIKQTKLVGVLYLENNLSPHVFTSGRMAVLDILASQAAISLENARLYAALERENLDRRHAEDALKSSEAFLAEGQRISRTGSWAWNIGTDRMVWSEEHSRIFGYEIDEVGGTFAAVLAKLSPEERASLSTTVGEAVRTGKSFSCEYQIAVPDGSIKHVQSVGRTVPNALGNVDEYVGTTVDITERKRTAEDLRRHEAALREAQSELAHVARVTTMGELTASIAHEVRQPIAGILLNASTCLRWLDRAATEPESIESARAALQRIVRDGNRAGDIITRIQALFRRTQTTKEPLNLNDTVRDIIVLAKGEIDKRRIALGLELSVELPNVLGDRIQLQQVLLNLILNAADAMASVEDRARDLVICTQHSEGQHVQVTVRDSGTGLSRENVEAAFTPFYTTKKNGLGMGLSISRSIVEDHAGRLWATGHEGPGASFHFSLPIAP